MSHLPESIKREEWLGVIAENAILGNERFQLIFMAEVFPNSKGRLETNPQEITVRGIDAEGKHYTLKTKAQSTITAEWVNRDPNRITAPQMMKGETVRVYRYDNDETFFWEPLNNQASRRTQETVVHAYAAKPKEAGKTVEESSPENCYSQTWDGVNGLVEFQCSKANGEISNWIISMNAKDGFLTISDRAGNVIRINGGGTVIDILNADKSHIQLDKKIINIYAPDTINVKADNYINIEAGKTINVKSGESINYETKDFTIKTNNYTCNGSNYTINCGSIALNGAVSVGQGLDVGGSVSTGGSVSIGTTIDVALGGTSGLPILGSGS